MPPFLVKAPQRLITTTAGTELVGLAATETPNPRQSMPGAVKGTFWRIVSHAKVRQINL